jgi:DNA-binding CsgD family transcriptional regulator
MSAEDTIVGALPRLSPREEQVLERMARGMTNSEVAADLFVSTHAVKYHLASIYRKFGVSNRTHAAARYVAIRAAAQPLEKL